MCFTLEYRTYLPAPQSPLTHVLAECYLHEEDRNPSTYQAYEVRDQESTWKTTTTTINQISITVQNNCSNVIHIPRIRTNFISISNFNAEIFVVYKNLSSMTHKLLYLKAVLRYTLLMYGCMQGLNSLRLKRAKRGLTILMISFWWKNLKEKC